LVLQLTRRDEVLDALRRHRDELQALGFAHVSLFGSTARGEARPDSDIDLLVELDRSKRLGLDYFSVLARVEEILGSGVDVVTLPVRKPRLLAAIEKDRVHAF
jgi:predicted nucleotidyltransferase